jgi:hypothetical protein
MRKEAQDEIDGLSAMMRQQEKILRKTEQKINAAQIRRNAILSNASVSLGPVHFKLPSTPVKKEPAAARAARVEAESISHPIHTPSEAFKPTNQIQPTSYIGRVLKQSMSANPNSGSSSESSSSDDQSDLDSESDEHAYSNSKDKSDPNIRRKKHKKSNWKMRLKPQAPEPYSGNSNTKDYHKFVVQSKLYLKDGNVPSN